MINAALLPLSRTEEKMLTYGRFERGKLFESRLYEEQASRNWFRSGGDVKKLRERSEAEKVLFNTLYTIAWELRSELTASDTIKLSRSFDTLMEQYKAELWKR